MHEMGLVFRIVEIAVEHAQKMDARRIVKIEIVLGDLSGVMYESLMFSFETAVKGTMLANAEIVVERVTGRGICRSCGCEYELVTLYGDCPSCGSAALRIIQGKEFRLKSISIV